MTSCYQQHLYVQQEWVDRNFLASTHVNAPDPRQAKPPEGQRLLIAWDFPKSLYQKELSLKTIVRLWNQSEQEFILKVPKKRGTTAYLFPKERILTYQVQVLSANNEVVETWDHHFWTEAINIKE